MAWKNFLWNRLLMKGPNTPAVSSRRTGKEKRKRRKMEVELLESREMPAAFTPGNLIVLQAGDNNQYSTQGPVYLNEYTTTPGAAIVQQAAVPATGAVGGTGNQ